MTPYERVMSRLEGKPVDKIPNLNIVMMFAGDYLGFKYGEYVSDYRKLVQARIKCAEEFGIDVVSCISDPMREAHAMGANVMIPEDAVPYSNGHLLEDYSDISKIKIVNPFEGERMLDRIKAVELFREEVGGHYPIIGWVEGALAEAADLRGVSEIMMDLLVEPDFCSELLEKTYEQTLMFAKAQIEAGADIIGVGDAVASLIGPDLYEKFAFPYQKKICDEIHKMGAKMKLHICGNTQSILPKIKEVGADIFDVDFPVDFKVAVDTFKGSITSANGNLHTAAVMQRGSEEDVIKAVQQCIAVSDETTMISAGCEIPRGTPYVNMKTMSRTLRL